MADYSSEFNENKELLLDTVQDLTTNLVLAKDRASTSSLFTDDKLVEYTQNSLKLGFQINTYLINMVSAFNKAYANIDDSFNELGELIDDNSSSLRTSQNEIKQKLHMLDGKINEIMMFSTDKTPDTNHHNEASILINNLKYNGKSIFGKTLSVKLLAYILQKRDDIFGGEDIFKEDDRVKLMDKLSKRESEDDENQEMKIKK